jgi:hypothetical protein
MNLFLKINKQFEKYKILSNEINNIYKNNNIIIKYPWNFKNQDFTEIRKTIVTYSKKKIYSNNEIINYTHDKSSDIESYSKFKTPFIHFGYTKKIVYSKLFSFRYLYEKIKPTRTVRSNTYYS